MKKMFLVMAAAYVFFLMLPCPLSHAQEKAITLNLSNMFPPENKNSVLMDQWCKELEKRTQGKVKVTQFYGGTLTPPAQTFAGVIKGIADIGASFASSTKGRFPLNPSNRPAPGLQEWVCGDENGKRILRQIQAKGI